MADKKKPRTLPMLFGFEMVEGPNGEAIVRKKKKKKAKKSKAKPSDALRKTKRGNFGGGGGL